MERFALTKDLNTIDRIVSRETPPGPVSKGWRWLPETNSVTVAPDAERRFVLDVPGDPGFFYEEIPADNLETRRDNVVGEFMGEIDEALHQGVLVAGSWFSVSLDAAAGSVSTAQYASLSRKAGATALPDGSTHRDKRDRDRNKVPLTAEQWADLYDQGWAYASLIETESSRIIQEIMTSDNPEGVDRSLP